MKSKALLFFAMLLMGTTATFAQMQQRPVSERVKAVMDRLGPLALNDEQKAKTDSIFTVYYNNQQKMMEQVRASGERPNAETMRKVTTDRDDQLKAVFTADQFKKFKNEIEESLRPQRRNN